MRKEEVVDRKMLVKEVKEVLADSLVRSVGELTEDTQLAMDDVDKVDVVMELEENFSIAIEEEVSDGWKTVKDVVDSVVRLVEGDYSK